MCVYGVGGGLLGIYATIDIGSIISDTKENRTSNLVGVALHASLLSAPTYMTFCFTVHLE